MTQSELTAYCFGFFDGEGTISIVRPRGFHHLVICAGQKEKAPLMLLQSVFGGKIYLLKVRGIKSGFQWVLTKQDEKLKFLEQATQFLQSKRAEAEIGLQFARLTFGSRRCRGNKITETELSHREDLRLKCAWIKRSKVMMEDERGQFDLPTNPRVLSGKN